jgi:hypothetical protein
MHRIPRRESRFGTKSWLEGSSKRTPSTVNRVSVVVRSQGRSGHAPHTLVVFLHGHTGSAPSRQSFTSAAFGARKRNVTVASVCTSGETSGAGGRGGGRLRRFVLRQPELQSTERDAEARFNTGRRLHGPYPPSRLGSVLGAMFTGRPRGAVQPRTKNDPCPRRLPSVSRPCASAFRERSTSTLMSPLVRRCSARALALRARSTSISEGRSAVSARIVTLSGSTSANPQATASR